MRAPAACVGVWAAIAFVASSDVLAQSPLPGGMPPPPGMSLARSAAMRFPQPVAVGLLIGRNVVQPAPGQRLLGRVRAVVRDAGGQVDAVVAHGGILGFGARPIAVPIDAMVLFGREMEIVAFSPRQLDAFPTFSASGTTPVPATTIVRIGLAKPSH